MNGISIIVRSSNENTSDFLIDDLTKRITSDDKLVVLNKKEPFVEKLFDSFKTALSLSKDFTIIIDADILLKKGFIKKLKASQKLYSQIVLDLDLRCLIDFITDLKYRGIHIYSDFYTNILSFFPLDKKILRPEQFVKKI